MVNPNSTLVLTGIRNISYRWLNRYSLRYGIDSLEKKERPKRGNNPRQESSKKPKVKKERRERKKVVKQRKKIRQE